MGTRSVSHPQGDSGSDPRRRQGLAPEPGATRDPALGDARLCTAAALGRVLDIPASDLPATVRRAAAFLEKPLDMT